jgi:hypothetical protein
VRQKSRQSSRKSRPLLVLAVVPAVVTASLLAPVVTTPTPSPRPVAPGVDEVRLAGVDAAALAEAPAPDVPKASRSFVGTSSGARRDGAMRPAVVTKRERTAHFALVGVTWAAGSAPVDGTVVQVRVREDGRWSGWETLDAIDSTDPTQRTDGVAEDRIGTEPLLTNGSDGVQVRVDTPDGRVPRDLRAELIDPGSSPADVSLTPKRARSTAAAEVAQPVIISRAQWGADERLRSGSPSYNATIKVGVVHHTASTNSYTEATAAAQVRAMYAYHTKSLGWSDIGYNFLVDKYGRIYEGRAGGIDKAVRGAHAGGFNVDTFGVSALGNYDTVAAPAGMVDAISRLMAWKLGLSFRDPMGTAKLTASSAAGTTSRYSNGTTITVPTIIGHRDVGQTACPGKYLYAQLATIRTQAAAYLGAAIADPTMTPTKAIVGTGAQISLTARTTTPQIWQLDIYSDANPGVPLKTVTGDATATKSVATGWDLVGPDGQPVPIGSYSLVLSSSGPAGAARTWVGRFFLNPVPPPPPPPTTVYPDPPKLSVIYTTPGVRTVAGRVWKTTCAEFGTTHRCVAYIKATYYRSVKGRYVRTVGFVLNAIVSTAPNSSSWSKNLYARTNTPTIAGKKYKVTCIPNNTAAPRICKTYVTAKLISRVKTSRGYTYKLVTVWQLNRIVRLVNPPAPKA